MRLGASVSLSQSIIPDRNEKRPESVANSAPKSAKEEGGSSKESGETSKKGDGSELKRSDEKALVAKLQARDSEVRAHEAAHLAAAGGIASGGASFSYQRGPDGKMYAIGGEVPISASGGGSPREKIKIMRQVAAAAMAPADPSPQDYAVAANARSEEMRALQELRKEEAEVRKELGMQRYMEASGDMEPSD
ncbi:putative metalloprotease CJM1_0395 family protein [Hydrogenimonas sp.]